MASQPSIQPENNTATRKSGLVGSFLFWFKIVRPHSLFASACPVLIGWKISLAAGGFHFTTALLTLLCAMSLQILSNLVNDYYDFLRGADKKGREGFQRPLAEGLLREQEMKNAALTALAASIALGGWLVIVGGWPILLIGLTSLLFAWLYTATDYSLSYLGIADIFVLLYYGIFACWGTVWLQQAASLPLWTNWQHISFQLQGYSLQTILFGGGVCGLLSMCVLAANNVRDIEDDRAVNKRTFAVRFGKTAALFGYALIVALMPVSAWLAYGFSPAVLIILPGAFLLYKMLTSSGAAYNRCLMLAGIFNAVYVVLAWFSL